jgi:hypothetical protein
MSQNPPKRIPLVSLTANRSTSPDKDSRIVNGYIEKSVDGEVYIYKRCGYSSHSIPAAGTGRGIFYWRGAIYSVVGGTLYKDLTSKGAVDATAGSFYTFTSCLGTIPKLLLQNGVEAYFYDDAGGLVNIIDADFPPALVPGIAYLDGTIYVMTPEAYVNGSDLEDPVNWDPLNSLLAQIEPDPGVALSKQMSYVVVFKGWSTEIFYDAQNATGSPLGRVEGAKVNVGCRHARSVQDLDGTLVWASLARSGGVSVMSMSGLKATDISNPSINRLLQDADFSSVYSWSMQANGHKFYILTLPTSNLSLVYDLKEGLWYRWTDPSGNYMPIVASASDADTRVILQHESSGELFEVSGSLFSDDSTIYSFDLYTPIYDAGTSLRKVVNILEVIGDRVDQGVLQVSFSDDDYTTWSVPRDFDLSVDRPRETDWGTFTKRAHHLHEKSALPLRIQAIDLHLDLGVL